MLVLLSALVRLPLNICVCVCVYVCVCVCVTQAYGLCVLVLLSALVRLPLKQVKGPGRKHTKQGENRERPAITFADVAGVDEAKEELAEIVVSTPSMCVCVCVYGVRTVCL